MSVEVSNKNSCALTLYTISAVSAYKSSSVVLHKTVTCSVVSLKKCPYFIHKYILMTFTLYVALFGDMTESTVGKRKLSEKQSS